MLAQQEYCGDIINFKTYSKSFRNKKRIDNPEENWAVFKDVHEPIIDRDTFEMVQKLVAKTKRRAPKKENGEKNMFCGLLYCADCGSPLWFNVNHPSKSIQYFNCSNYRANRGTCPSTHYIRADSIEKVVIVRDMANKALFNELESYTSEGHECAYPYLIPILKEYLFKPFSVTDIEMGEYANLIYDRYINSNNYEACSFAILYAIDADCELVNFNIQKIMESKDCILLLMAYLYCKKRGWRGGIDKLKKHAKQIVKDNELDQYWIFVYEILGSGSLKDDWASMKKSKVSFLKDEYK